MSKPGKHHFSPEWAFARLPGPGGEDWATVFEHGSLEVGVYAPRGADTQSPHTRDEVYIVRSGSGFFRNGDERNAFGPGDLLFVPAGTAHRFEDFSDDFSAWYLMYGPEGGE